MRQVKLAKSRRTKDDNVQFVRGMVFVKWWSLLFPIAISRNRHPLSVDKLTWFLKQKHPKNRSNERRALAKDYSRSQNYSTEIICHSKSIVACISMRVCLFVFLFICVSLISILRFGLFSWTNLLLYRPYLAPIPLYVNSSAFTLRWFSFNVSFCI